MNKFLSPYQKQLERCSACGECLSVCPVFSCTHLEPDSPRGRILIIRALMRGQIEAQEAAASIKRCLLCGQCASICPAQLPLPEIFMACSRLLAQKHLAFSLVYRLSLWLAKTQKARISLHRLVAILPEKARNRQGLLNLPKKPFNINRNPDPHNKKRALLFTGCIARHFYPRLAKVSIDALEQNGYSVILPGNSPCCGRPFIQQGTNPGFFARKALALFEKLDFDVLVTPCPGCLNTFKNIWPKLPRLTLKEAEALAKLSTISYDLGSLLVKSANLSRASGQKFFWHQPCLMDAGDAARISTAFGVKPKDEVKLSCCGGPLLANRLSIRNKANSISSEIQTITKSLALRIRADAHDADFILTNCPGCILALSRFSSLPVKHVVEFYMERQSPPDN